MTQVYLVALWARAPKESNSEPLHNVSRRYKQSESQRQGLWDAQRDIPIEGRLIGRPFLGCELCEQLVGFLQCNWYRKVSNTTLFDKCASTYRFDNVIN